MPFIKSKANVVQIGITITMCIVVGVITAWMIEDGPNWQGLSTRVTPIDGGFQVSTEPAKVRLIVEVALWVLLGLQFGFMLGRRMEFYERRRAVLGRIEALKSIEGKLDGLLEEIQRSKMGGHAKIDTEGDHEDN